MTESVVVVLIAFGWGAGGETLNKKEFDFSGISAWHEKSYTGKNIRIANLEGTDPSLWFFNGK